MSILILSLVVTLIFLLHRYKATRSNPNVPPSPPRLPFIGNLHQLNPSLVHQSLFELSNKYGPLLSLKFGSIPALVVSSARLAEEVLKKQDLTFCNRPKKYALQKFSYNGLDIAMARYSKEWREMKKISVVHLLSAKRIQQFLPILRDELSTMMREIARDAQQHTATNLSDTLKSFSLTFICRIAFGKRLSNESRERKIFDNLVFNEGAELILEGVFFSDFFPFIGWIDRLFPMHSQLQRLFEIFDTFIQDLIHEHLDPKRPESMDGDIIDIMIKLQQSKSTSFVLTMDHIKAMVMDLFFAGVDASSRSITMAMAALIRNPDVMKKLQAEIREKMGDKEMVEQDDIEKLPYLKATVKEVMRLYPAAPILLPREPLEKCNLDGYEIEPKSYVIVSAMAIGRDPEVWECPDEFRPERFMNSSMDLKGNDFGLIPFGSGRRSCPGTSMALLTVHLVLANLINSFDWKLPPGIKVEDINMQSFYNRKVAFKLVATHAASV